MSTQGASKPTIYLQESCLKHQYIRSRDTSSIVERPERLRAVNIGLSAAIARLEQDTQLNIKEEETSPNALTGEKSPDPDDLAAALGRLKIEREEIATLRVSPAVSIVKSRAQVNILNNAAVKHIHGDIDGDLYLENLKKWATSSPENIQNLGSEIPEGYPQGDLYLCPESLEAISGALGTVCEAVDKVITSSRQPTSVQSPSTRAFVAVRPPGHHCGEDTPCGFCFVNNVAVGAAHAHLNHGINRVVIFDIDLHHGNGTQSIVWQINEESYREQLEIEAGAPEPEKGLLRVYYGSAHDILSYPCEDGKMDLIQAASVSIHQAHGQCIENVHLAPYLSEEQFWEELYDKQYGKLLRTAEAFLEKTGGAGDDTLVFISCGMDACEHEYSSMQRHGRKVPTSLYYRFTRDACDLSERYAQGRLVSVLEGGYSDRALISGSMAHLCGLFDETKNADMMKKGWWSVENLEKIEKVTKKRRGGRTSLGGSTLTEPWLERTQEIFQQLDTSPPKPSLPPAPSRTLRERKPGTTTTTPTASPGRPKKATAMTSPGPEPKKTVTKAQIKKEPPSVARGSSPTKVGVSVLAGLPVRSAGYNVLAGSGGSTTSSEEESGHGPEAKKKVPKVRLKLGPNPSVAS